MKTIYLSGSVTGIPVNTAKKWRTDAITLFDEYMRYNPDTKYKIINPIDLYNFNMDKSTYTEKEIMTCDLHKVDESDIILVNLDGKSVGTGIELYKAWESKKPIIGFNKTETSHVWSIELCDKICTDLFHAVNYIINYYN